MRIEVPPPRRAPAVLPRQGSLYHELGECRAAPHSLPHVLPHNLLHNMPPNLLHALPHNLLHALPHNLPHNQPHTLPHNLLHALPHGLPIPMPTSCIPLCPTSSPHALSSQCPLMLQDKAGLWGIRALPSHYR